MTQALLLVIAAALCMIAWRLPGTAWAERTVSAASPPGGSADPYDLAVLKDQYVNDYLVRMGNATGNFRLYRIKHGTVGTKVWLEEADRDE